MKTQRGSILLEYLVILVLTLLATIWAINAWAERRTTLELETKALWMQAVQKAVTHYIERFSFELHHSEPYSAQQLEGVHLENWQHPTLSELKALGVLPAAFSDQLEDKVKVWVFKASENCSEEWCFLHAIIAAQKPLITSQGVADAKRLSLWRELTKGSGLVVQAPYEQWIAAQHLRWPNIFGQQGGLPEGSIALAIQGDELWHRYLRVRDERDPLFQNQVTVMGQVYSDHSLVTEGYLAMRAHAQVGEHCSEEGAVAHDAQLPALLACRQGQWRWMIGHDGGSFIHDQYGNCYHPLMGDTRNSVTGSCGCGKMFLAIPIALFTDEHGNVYRSHLCRPQLTLY